MVQAGDMVTGEGTRCSQILDITAEQEGVQMDWPRGVREQQSRAFEKAGRARRMDGARMCGAHKPSYMLLPLIYCPLQGSPFPSNAFYWSHSY